MGFFFAPKRARRARFSGNQYTGAKRRILAGNVYMPNQTTGGATGSPATAQTRRRPPTTGLAWARTGRSGRQRAAGRRRRPPDGVDFPAPCQTQAVRSAPLTGPPAPQGIGGVGGRGFASAAPLKQNLRKTAKCSEAPLKQTGDWGSEEQPFGPNRKAVAQESRSYIDSYALNGLA